MHLLNMNSDLASPAPTSGPIGLMPTRARRSHRGFTLIEVMVAMVVTAFGVLGVIGMNATSIKLQSDAANRSRAALHAQDILDRMRANPVRARAGQYNILLTATATLPKNPTIANSDIVAWRINLGQTLAGGTGSVAVTPNGDVQVQIQWNERQSRLGGGANQSFIFTSSL